MKLPPPPTATTIPPVIPPVVPLPSAPLPEEQEVLTSRALLLFVTLLLVTLGTSYALQRHRIRIIHESVVALVLGSLVGLMVRIGSSTVHLADLLAFKHTYFFNLLLPPIILHSGYGLREGDFFGHLGPIAVFAVLGTATSILVIAVITYPLSVVGLSPLTFVDCLRFGCILSSTDPVTVLAIFSQLGVDARLYSILFGESLLNDSVAIVLFSALNSSHASVAPGESPLGWHLLGEFFGVFVGSLAIGVGIALGTALMLKHSDLYRFPTLEVCLVALLAYASYLVAQSTGMSGIVSLLFSGIALKHYAHNNMSRRTRLATEYLFSTLSQLSETFIFIYLGITLFTTQLPSFSIPLIVVTFVAILVARYISVFPFAAAINALGRRMRVTSGRAAASGMAASAMGMSTSGSMASLSGIGSGGVGQDSSTAVLDRPVVNERTIWTLYGLLPRSQPGPDVIPRNHQIMLWWAGLRGAVSFALALEVASPNPAVAPVVQSTTLVVVFATILIFGGTVPQALRHFNIKTQAVVESVTIPSPTDGGRTRRGRRNQGYRQGSTMEAAAAAAGARYKAPVPQPPSRGGGGMVRADSIPLVLGGGGGAGSSNGARSDDDQNHHHGVTGGVEQDWVAQGQSASAMSSRPQLPSNPGNRGGSGNRYTHRPLPPPLVVRGGSGPDLLAWDEAAADMDADAASSSSSQAGSPSRALSPASLVDYGEEDDGNGLCVGNDGLEAAALVRRSAATVPASSSSFINTATGTRLRVGSAPPGTTVVIVSGSGSGVVAPAGADNWFLRMDQRYLRPFFSRPTRRREGGAAASLSLHQ
ncbi:Sodium/hydrogen exchanger family-domain-containing protein [Blastocladiella britannica]|nr:Sodium/hydrogen exchanger family-domain-containing protein [Blastocladiella britannica]